MKSPQVQTMCLLCKVSCLLALTSTLFFSSCQNLAPSTIDYSQDILHGYWRLVDQDIVANPLLPNPVILDQPVSTEPIYSVFLPGGMACTLVKTQMSSFKWNIKSSEGILNAARPFQFSDILGETSDSLKFYITKNKQDTILHIWQPEVGHHMRFTKLYSTYKGKSGDPMHPIHNQWRIKKEGALSKEEIKQRAINYLHHNFLLHEAALADPNRKFSNKHTLGVLVYYKGAIGLCDREKISDEWLGIFKDWEEAQKMYDAVLDIMGDKMVRSKKKTSNWVEMNHSILKDVLSDYLE